MTISQLKRPSTLVKLVARPGRSPAQAHPIAQPCQGASSGMIVARALANNLLQTSRQQRADGDTFFRSQAANLAQQRCIKFQSDFRHNTRIQLILLQNLSQDFFGGA